MKQNHELHRIVDKLAHIRVLVIGDVMLDIYEHCLVHRISPEAPVPIATIVNDSFFLGGAGNVANNIQALGAAVTLIGVVGNDREATLVRGLLEEQGIDHTGLLNDVERVTTSKKRVVSGTQQLLRIDREVTHNISQETTTAIVAILQEKIQDHDVIVISDYCKGLLSNALIQSIKDEAVKEGKKIFVDSKHHQLHRYAGVYLIKPNKEEAESLTGEVFLADYSNLEYVGKRASTTLGSHLVVTLGSDGIALFEDDQFFHMKTKALQVFDVSGAGDTVLAVIAASVATGASLTEAVHLSNIAAGYVVSRLGTTVCSKDTLKQILETQ